MFALIFGILLIITGVSVKGEELTCSKGFTTPAYSQLVAIDIRCATEEQIKPDEYQRICCTEKVEVTPPEEKLPVPPEEIEVEEKLGLISDFKISHLKKYVTPYSLIYDTYEDDRLDSGDNFDFIYLGDAPLILDAFGKTLEIEKGTRVQYTAQDIMTKKPVFKIFATTYNKKITLRYGGKKHSLNFGEDSIMITEAVLLETKSKIKYLVSLWKKDLIIKHIDYTAPSYKYLEGPPYSAEKEEEPKTEEEITKEKAKEGFVTHLGKALLNLITGGKEGEKERALKEIGEAH